LPNQPGKTVFQLKLFHKKKNNNLIINNSGKGFTLATFLNSFWAKEKAGKKAGNKNKKRILFLIYKRA
jgi:hypothetical protein